VEIYAAGLAYAGVEAVFFAERAMLGMKYKVALHRSDEGFAVSVPGLPGCWSQGRTEAEALDNIRKAIEEYLAAVDGELKGATIREVEVAA
jgi:predicted RNase H-like HicB family nuclease